MARSYAGQNVVNRSFELQPRSGERSYDSLLQPRSGERSYANVATTVCFFKIRRNSSRDIRLCKILIRTMNNPGLIVLGARKSHPLNPRVRHADEKFEVRGFSLWSYDVNRELTRSG